MRSAWSVIPFEMFKKNNTFWTMAFAIFILGLSVPIFPQMTSHWDWQKLPKQCASCHVGHGTTGTAMLPLSEEDFCYQCHGNVLEVGKSKRDNRISLTVEMKNLRTEFQKPYRHPVELQSNTYYGSSAQEESVYRQSQAECLDCHRGHGVDGTQSSAGLSQKRSTKVRNEYEYQLCYKCHANIIQSSVARKNIKTWFETTNPSFHPVETVGKNSHVPSFKEPYSISSLINCTDCHNNSDLSGPKGPHGSDYKFILERNYNTQDFVPESESQYALCYKCHNRDSILNDESFPFHNEHIVGESASCFTCHNSHGSQRNSHLIKFDEEPDPFVMRASSSGRFEFVDKGECSGSCFLNCHGADHNPKFY